ncbi:MAG: DUF1573 domain-containing protein [Pedobacter sp.]|nr:MAG: DUF1573 domain-containing protein [Pedobacter sp.]
MKKLIVLFAFVLGFGVAGQAQTTTPAEQSDAPDFKFDKETFDFGKIPTTKPVSVEFKFTNIGEKPLIITNVAASCGCTVPEWPKTPIKKGQSGVIKVTYTPTPTAMPFTKPVTITSNAKISTKYLYIKGQTVAPGTATTAAN